MKILVLSQYFPPEKSFIPETVAEQLTRRGHDVRVLTGYPNYPEGRVYPGYKVRGVKKEKIEGFEVLRVPLVISHSRNPIGRIFNYLSFGVSAAVFGWSYAREADIVYVYATQMTASIPALAWNFARGQTYVLHVQDLWPGSVTGSGMLGPIGSRVAEQIMQPWLRATYQRAAAIVGISPSMTKHLRGQGARVAKTVLNWSREISSGSADSRKRITEPGMGLNLIYAGNIGEMQDLQTVINAVESLAGLPGLRLNVFGAGVAEDGLRKYVERHEISNVVFHGRVSREELSEHLALADFQLIPLKDLDVFESTVPSKLQGSLREGIPVITTVRGDTSALVEASGGGLTVVPNSPTELAAAVSKAYWMSYSEYEVMSRSAKAFYEEKMSMDSGIKQIEAILQRASNLSRRAVSTR